MSDKDFNGILDQFLLTRKITGDPGMLETMTVIQRIVLNEIKKSIKRTNK